MNKSKTDVDVLIIGGGQAALATAYFLRRTSLSFIILDDQAQAGGAWQHAWDSLQLFSPTSWSSLPGWMMPARQQTYPSRDEVISYLTQYEQRYQFPIVRPIRVDHVLWQQSYWMVCADEQYWTAKAVVNATGTWGRPFIPYYPGQEDFNGVQLHSAQYQNSDPYIGKKVMVVGGGNSAAQLLAEVSKVAETTWVTLSSPQFLPDDVDGRVLFLRATERLKAQQEGRRIEQPLGGFGDIVMIDSVKDVRMRGVLHSQQMFSKFTSQGVQWQDGSCSEFDAVIWCTGFQPALQHLQSAGVVEADGKVQLEGTRAVKQPNLWFVGYGDWSGVASATLIGVSRTARSTVDEIVQVLKTTNQS